MAQNKRRSVASRKTVPRRKAVAKPAGSNGRGRRKQIEEEQKILHAQIGALEGFIAGSPFREKRERAESKGVIPPPEGRRGAAAKRGGRRVCYAQQRERHAKRDQHVIVFFFLFVAACWLAWWLLSTAGN